MQSGLSTTVLWRGGSSHLESEVVSNMTPSLASNQKEQIHAPFPASEVAASPQIIQPTPWPWGDCKEAMTFPAEVPSHKELAQELLKPSAQSMPLSGQQEENNEGIY